MFSGFTSGHRGGSGSSLVLLHGFMDTWRSWELVLPTLERRHDVFALTLPGHAGGPPLGEGVSVRRLVDAVEYSMHAAGIEIAHLVGNSLGGDVALQLAARGRAKTVVAFAPAGGWTPGDESPKELLRAQLDLHTRMKALAPHADSLVSTQRGRRQATQPIATNFEHIPPDLIAHQVLGIASCKDAIQLIKTARREAWPLDVEMIACPVRIIWGKADKLLPWPRAAERYRKQLPQSDWVLLDGIGHSPQLDVPLEAAQLITGFTG
jgi:pimeloyl-ACP methyl ester carboxylesterase